MQSGPCGMSGATALRLAELLATRFSHDISGPLAGLVAGVGELGADAEALPIVQDATAALRHRLALLRAAWGEALAPLAGSDLPGLVRGLPGAHRLQVDLAPALALAIWPAPFARVLLNALIVAAESLPQGGSITLLGEAGSSLMLLIAGPRTGWPPGFALMLADEAAGWAAIDAAAGVAAVRALQPAFTALLAHASGVQARLLLGPPGDQPPPLLLEPAP